MGGYIFQVFEGCMRQSLGRSKCRFSNQCLKKSKELERGWKRKELLLLFPIEYARDDNTLNEFEKKVLKNHFSIFYINLYKFSFIS